MKKAGKPIVKKLPANHNWTAPDGYKIVVIDRGAALFNIPRSWEVTDFEPFTVRDAKVPDDTMGVQTTVMRLPAGINWDQLPLINLLADATRNTGATTLRRGDHVSIKRDGIEIAWTEHLDLDVKEKRENYSRIAIARADSTHVLITFAFWLEDTERALPVWDEVMRSLQVGLVLEDPSKGRKLH